MIRRIFTFICICLLVLSPGLGGCEKNTPSPTPTETPSIAIKTPEPSDMATQTPLPAETPPAKPEFKYNEYNITMDVEPTERKVAGVEKILFFNRYDEPLNQIYLNVYLNAFSEKSTYKPYFSEFQNKIFASGMDYGHMDIVNASVNGVDTGYTLDNTVLKVELKDPILPGHEAEIALQFESVIPKISHRTGANNYAIWLGNFFPTLAVYQDGAWMTNPYYAAGDPFVSEIANYTLKVKTPAGYTVAGTGDEAVTLGEGSKETVLTAKMVRDMAVAISNSYQVESRQIDTDLYVNLYHYSDISNIDELLDTAVKSIKYYSSVIGTYPYSSFDILETELFIKGGMEYPQATFIDTSYLKSENNISTLCHEIGHQWFYNILGNDQVHEAWLDEGLSSFMQMGILYGDEEIKQMMEESYDTLNARMIALPHKALTDDLSVYETWSQYYNIQYKKASLMFYSLKNVMGGELFTKLMQKYYLDNCYKLTSGETFIKTAEEVYGGSLTGFFDAWMRDDALPPLYS